MNLAYETTVANGNYELASCMCSRWVVLTKDVMSLDLAARRFSNRPHDIQLVLDRYNVIRPFIAPPVKVLLNARKFLTMFPSLTLSSAICAKPSRIHPGCQALGSGGPPSE
jgi:hypothetical protein